MSEILLASLLLATTIVLVLQIVLLRRPVASPPDFSEMYSRTESVLQSIQNVERGSRDEFSRLRQEIAGQQQAFKLEVAGALNTLNLSLEQKIELLRYGVVDSGGQLQTQVGQEMERLRSGLSHTAQQSREEIAGGLKVISETQQTRLDEIRATVETRLKEMTADNERRLEQMRQTVEEKLQGTLETRLGESFKQVSERLEAVHKGLGEMQALASGVGNLQRTLTNVKTRGTWGEVQLGNLLQELLAPEQFEKNVATTGTLERVEFAIKLPGQQEGETCWLPVDSKFPVADYERIVDASEAGDGVAVAVACKSLERTLRLYGKTVSEKYVLAPRTTDFAILFLPTEGIYAEVLRIPGLTAELQREYRIILAGPTTFAALLNSLRMGFQTLAIQHRSSEILKTLSNVKTHFAKYAGVLAKVKKKLQEASNSVDTAERQTSALQRSLVAVESGRQAEHQTELSLFEDAESLTSETA
ncbi:MAG: DNA recombination protein RmuC [Acidobacteria bacterium]|nr:DNA recombination protein RmuC [Acidobacteriota bacterium]